MEKPRKNKSIMHGNNRTMDYSVDTGIRGKRAKAIPVTLMDTSMVDYGGNADFLQGHAVR
jgi:hypothetical protein